MDRWHLFTGEYPPQPGGVADYTYLVARGLARVGDEVHIFAPACPSSASASTSRSSLEDADSGVTVHRLPDHFGPRGLAWLDAARRRLPRADRLLVQYVPHAYGWKAMNVPFCWWLHSRRRETIWTMFHEVAFPLEWKNPLRHQLLGATNHLMAWLIARSSRHLFVSIPAWETQLRRLLRRPPPVTWLPVPSNLPTSADAPATAGLREQYGLSNHEDDLLLGHFGTYGDYMVQTLQFCLPDLLTENPRLQVLLLGRGAQAHQRRWLAAHPTWQGRLHAGDNLEGQNMANHLAACDLLLQPYSDGASARRGSLMGGLALGRAIATTSGALTEPIWHQCESVLLAPADRPDVLRQQTQRLLQDVLLRRSLQTRAARLYAQEFSLERTIERLLACRDGRPFGQPSVPEALSPR